MPSCSRCHECAPPPAPMRSEGFPEKHKRRRRRPLSLTKKTFPSPVRRVLPSYAIAVSFTIRPTMISALQVRGLPQPHIRAGSRQSRGSKPPNWVIATTSTMIPTVRSADTAYGIIMYNSCLDEFEEGTNNGNADNRLTLGDTRIYGSNGAGDIGGSSPGTLSLAEVSARSGGPTRHPSKAPSRTALQASRYGSGDGGRRGKRTRPTNSSGSDGSREQ